MAERVARLAVAALPGLRTAGIRPTSAGTHAIPGQPMHPGAREILREIGADCDGFTSRPLSADLVAHARLVLTAARQQRAICVSTAPSALRRTFTLRQFARLTASVDPECLRGVVPRRRLAVLVDEVLRVRGELQPVPPGDDDLRDPVNGTLEDVRVCLATIQSCLRPVFSLIAGA